MATSYTDKVSDTATDTMNASRRAISQAQGAIGKIDMDTVTSQLKEVVRMGDDFRRARPLIFWGAIAGVSALVAVTLFRSSKA